MLLGTQHWKRGLALTAVVNSTTTRFVLYKLYDNRRQCRWLMLWYKICKYCALAEEGSRNQTLCQTGTDHPNLPTKAFLPAMQHFGKAALRVTKNYTKGYSDTQSKVRDATSNDPWGPSGTQMNDIAQMTYNQSVVP